MQSLKLTVTNENGFHARPGATFVKACKQFSSSIRIEREGQQANAKSLMKLLGLGVVCGDVITLHIEGDDEAQAACALKDVVGQLEG